MDSMSMSMNMPMSETSMGAMPSSTMGGHSHGGASMGMDMGMGMGAGSMMSMSMMSMTFFTSIATPLYSESWTPSSQGQYAGTCIFLIVLSVLLRLMYGLKCQLESYWQRQASRRRYIIAAGPAPHKDSAAASHDSGDAREVLVAGKQADGSQVGTLTVNGIAERVRVVQPTGLKDGLASRAAPFKLNIDLVRACFVTVMVGVAYLLMLAVMTMNVGYFLSVLGGAFLGELVFGRWAVHTDVDHH